MTRFIGEAVGQRSGRGKGTSTADLRKEMEEFQKTGRHAELEQAAAAERVPALPERDQNRPHIFLDLRQHNRTLGRLVIEIFEDQLPTTARHLMNRCREGMEDSFKNTTIHKLVPDLAIFGGLSRGYKKNSSTKLKQHPKLHHSQKGSVSISLAGDEFAITFLKALPLDSTHQESLGCALLLVLPCMSLKQNDKAHMSILHDNEVVGRVHVGMEILDKINGTEVDYKDIPVSPLTVSGCGITDSEGTHQSLAEAEAAIARQKETPEQAAARLQAEANTAKDSLQDALQTGLGQKRKGSKPVQPGGTGKRRYIDALDDQGSSSDSGDNS